MQSSLYVSLSAQVAMEKRLNTIANNVANINTGGFRADEVKFEEILSLAAKESVSFASSGQNYVSRRTGPIVKTDNPLDVAIQGEAWFAFNGPGGPVYTRDGRFRMNENGDLLTLEGHPVLDAGGAPITLDPNAGAPTIGRDGTITQGANQVGSIGLFTLRADSKLARFGNSGVTSSIPGELVQDFNANGVQQGYSEGSNVNPVLEMTKMIAVQRNFESAATTIQESESTLMDAIRTLGPSS
ncbi:flagellar basal-body rod protein FlgF [Microvirga arsenatis]|uniref:Flagellar basal-body rod protein FlgF n=1 Tax=Microvirga arsenatis TaxID=2692265 RepID=A0ABW9Z1X2_9HYPH|nr:flagellar basal-body rod protein FlgF [Microvirga arsenatis]NBJ11020.1 flagellar basal-body rod protein FlgF [Microvirga arsenatis]NBJ25293.1 flagellar basal-body rod protein FlgF [Microvirga arsenatis]